MSHLNASLFSFLQLLIMCAVCAGFAAAVTAAVGVARRSTLRHELRLARDGQMQANRLLHQLLPLSGWRSLEPLTPAATARHGRGAQAALNGPTVRLPLAAPRLGSPPRRPLPPRPFPASRTRDDAPGSIACTRRST
jgi:hypothetical protein